MFWPVAGIKNLLPSIVRRADPTTGIGQWCIWCLKILEGLKKRCKLDVTRQCISTSQKTASILRSVANLSNHRSKTMHRQHPHCALCIKQIAHLKFKKRVRNFFHSHRVKVITKNVPRRRRFEGRARIRARESNARPLAATRDYWPPPPPLHNIMSLCGFHQRPPP